MAPAQHLFKCRIVPMRFLIAVIDDNTNTAGPDEMAHIDAFNDKLQANGHFIIAVGVAGPEKATLIDNRNGLGDVQNRPLHDTKEFMSGFWLINAADLDEAKALAAEGSKACNRKVELRPLLG
jgi:hypothetical protein